MQRDIDDDDDGYAASWEEIGAALGISGEFARQIGLGAMAKMRRACEEYGISHWAVYVSRRT